MEQEPQGRSAAHDRTASRQLVPRRLIPRHQRVGRRRVGGPVRPPSAPARPLLNESFVERDARISVNGLMARVRVGRIGPAVVARCSAVSAPPRRVHRVQRAAATSRCGAATAGSCSTSTRSGSCRLSRSGRRRTAALPSVRPSPLQIPRFAERHSGTVYDVSPDGPPRVFSAPRRRARAPARVRRGARLACALGRESNRGAPCDRPGEIYDPVKTASLAGGGWG